jgi:RimJ/RimL family protein N-acetyltransferase
LNQIVWSPSADCEFNKHLAQWLAVHIAHDGRSVLSPCLCFGVFSNGKLQGAVAFHDWKPHYGTIEFSAASSSGSWLSRAVIREIARYAFDELGCHLLITQNDPDNTRVIRIIKSLGFDQILIPNLRGKGKAGSFMTLTVEQRNASRFIRSS